MHAALLLPAMLVDAAIGEPRALWSRVPHPAVLLGRLVGFLDARLNRGRFRRARGAAAVVVLCGIAVGAGHAIGLMPLAPLWQTLAAATLLAQRSLAEHVAAVADALERSTSEGRIAVARIVGRDTDTMDRPEIARAAIESAAENLSDAVVAPVLWFLLAGLPGLVFYKAVNTADSMIGYRTDRHAEFGWAAARLDDLVNLVPARLTALMILAAGLCPAPMAPLAADARRHRSPNAGWPEAAMARVLDVALSGPRSYAGSKGDFPFVHPAGRHDIGAAEIRAAVTLLWRVWAVLAGLAGLAGLAALMAVA